MITAIVSYGQVQGAEIWMVGWLVCAAAYFAIVLANKRNRKGVQNVLLWFLVAEVLTDLVWALIYYDKSGYINRGIGAVYGLLLWPLALMICGTIATVQNKQPGNK